MYINKAKWNTPNSVANTCSRERERLTEENHDLKEHTDDMPQSQSLFSADACTIRDVTSLSGLHKHKIFYGLQENWDIFFNYFLSEYVCINIRENIYKLNIIYIICNIYNNI